jgi:hypothetical protein
MKPDARRLGAIPASGPIPNVGGYSDPFFSVAGSQQGSGYDASSPS